MVWYWFVGAWYVGLTMLAFCAMGLDKRAASRGGRRVRESTLLWLAGAGGFAGVIAAMLVLKHKTRKVAFRVLPWTAAVLHVATWVLISRG